MIIAVSGAHGVPLLVVERWHVTAAEELHRHGIRLLHSFSADPRSVCPAEPLARAS